MKKYKYTGWSLNRRMFTAAQYKNSYLSTRYNYTTYVRDFKRQMKIPKLRKELLK